jgi:hypothetical protein
MKLIVAGTRHYRWNEYKQGWYWETYWRVYEAKGELVITKLGLQRWPMTKYDNEPLEFESSEAAIKHIKKSDDDVAKAEIEVRRELSEISPGYF